MSEQLSGQGVGIVAVDDSDENLFTLTSLLEQNSYQVRTASNGREAIALIEDTPPDLILMDINMPEMDGYEATRKLRSNPRYDNIPIVLLTSRDDIEDIRKGLSLGADDYIKKPFNASELLSRIEIVLKQSSPESERLHPDHESEGLRQIIGDSPAIKHILKKIRDMKDSDASVVVTGESGSGKELVVRAIHALSQRSNAILIAQNCSALSESLLESELFGHVRGAFTGAVRDKKGLFEVADSGTLFLDELGEMSLPLQAKLLRVLQDGAFTPVGSHEEKKVDVRVIAATHRNLEELVREGRFREDLFYRLHVVSVTLPPLRERSEDVGRLVEHFLSECHAHREDIPVMTPEALKLLQEYAWPGNIRELRNEIERIAALHADLSPIPPSVLSPKFFTSKTKDQVPAQKENLAMKDLSSLKQELADVEKRYIERALELTGGNKSEAARMLEISRSSLIQKARQYFGDE